MTMSSMASLTVYDGQATSVAHNFLPVNNGKAGLCRWQDREHNSGIGIGFSNLTLSAREPTNPGGPFRVTMQLSVPKLDTSTVIPTVSGIGRATVEFIFPGNYTQADRTDLRVMVMNALGSGLLGGNIQEMVLPY